MTIRVVLGVSGGIAAYKSAEIVRALVDGGAEVRVVMTPAATRFLAPLTLSVLSKNAVIADLWDPSSGAVDHVALARWADVLAVAPATADVLAKLAHGIGDDVLTTYALGHRKALLVAPAMNTWMWAHPATEENLGILKSRGATVVEPDAGDLACGDVGPGRLAPPARIARAILACGAVARSLEGRRILVTAGPTREPVDPVRFISNRSSGKMGYALAREAARRGADVVLVSGPVSLAPPPGARLVRVERAAEMRDAVLAEIGESDALLMAAAPADFAVPAPAAAKIRRAAGAPRIELAPTPDILREASGAARRTAVLVGFAAETQDLLANAAKKLTDKGVDLLVGNDVSRPGIGFDADENEVVLLAPGAEPVRVERSSKTVVAGRILDRVAELLDVKCPKIRNAHAPSAR
ncbi:MAG TPA: bifunctional phosphopantothenoylcysteine decarboxylase/phosphopantothenate--cysteine ligase CoaBC [Thermoanaerobaculia bacterium]|nr:bifunctional phosphopantothenoylcysteine decarboxylase/phosphopantothenate--cysteine ligase CoaBC [Thermoanaerobaculia bacterium]